MSGIKSVSIKFKPGAYNLFPSFKYKIWLALTEYVDNAIQSYLSNKESLLEADPNYKFQIDIKYEQDIIKIWDNAAGIDTKNIQRAFEPANIPDNNKGLHEYGMGMKTASIWLAKYWSVRTAALGETEERLFEFNLEEVTTENKEELPIINTPKKKNVHFTEITLWELTENGKNRQLEKIKKHIASIHRNLIRTNEVTITFNGEKLSYTDPPILKAPYYKEENGEIIEWKKNIEYQFGRYKIKGFIGILEKMSTSMDNGLSLFRRGRVIEGSHDEKYRPKSLCGQVGSPRYKRIFGELEVDGFEVSFDKGSFRNPDELEYILEQLKIELSKENYNIFLQAENYRSPKAKENTQKAVRKTIKKAKKEQEEQNDIHQINNMLNEFDASTLISNEPTTNNETTIDEITEIQEIKGYTYKLKIEFINDKNVSDLYSLMTFENKENRKLIDVICKINLDHPFFIKHELFSEKGDYSPILQIIKSFVYAELTASKVGSGAGYVRLYFNQFIKSL